MVGVLFSKRLSDPLIQKGREALMLDIEGNMEVYFLLYMYTPMYNNFFLSLTFPTLFCTQIFLLLSEICLITLQVFRRPLCFTGMIGILHLLHSRRMLYVLQLNSVLL